MSGKSLAARVRFNVHNRKGLSNDVIRKFCKQTCSKDFKGVFAADRIPRRLCVQPNFIIVVNLGRRGEARSESDLPVGHFVTILGAPEAVYFLDPYGFPCTQPNVIKFMGNCRRAVMQNKRSIQDITSVYCGMYAILFANYLDKGWSFRVRFCKKHLLRNDKRCVAYLEKMFGKRKRKIKPCKH